MTSLYPITIHRYDSAEPMGRRAGEHAARLIHDAQTRNGRARVMLAAAPSQAPTLAALADAVSLIDFARVDFFHMDDYIGLPPDAPQGFGNWLDRTFFDRVPATTFRRIDTSLAPDHAAARYAEVLGDEPFDVTLCGLGVNGHLAFNDPPADFHDQQSARVIVLDEVSRQQQVDEGHFPDLASVPTNAITVTIPRLLKTAHVICSVIGTAKRKAVSDVIGNDPDPNLPGTALKLHPDAHLYVDSEAYHV
jgi:glucosamine-6-phosphate deaminase